MAQPTVGVPDDEPEMRKALRRLLTCRGIQEEGSRVKATILRTFPDPEEKDEADRADRQCAGLGDGRQPAKVKPQTNAPASAVRQTNQAEC